MRDAYDVWLSGVLITLIALNVVVGVYAAMNHPNGMLVLMSILGVGALGGWVYVQVRRWSDD